MNLWSQGDYKIQVELLEEASKGCHDLLTKHWMEIAHYKDEVSLNPRWAEFYALEKVNKLVILTLRQEETLIGYSMFVLNNHLHYDILVAFNDILYVHPDKRKSKFGLQLISESEKYLKSIGVRKVQWHVKPHMDFSAVLLRREYVHEENIFGKLL
jgi:GNAT superfamily N-acetyltransferase